MRNAVKFAAALSLMCLGACATSYQYYEFGPADLAIDETTALINNAETATITFEEAYSAHLKGPYTDVDSICGTANGTKWLVCAAMENIQGVRLKIESHKVTPQSVAEGTLAVALFAPVSATIYAYSGAYALSNKDGHSWTESELSVFTLEDAGLIAIIKPAPDTN